MEPFIYTFKTPRNFYFYDVNKDEIVKVSEDIYQYLNKNKINNELSIDDQNEIKSLESHGYLSDNRVKTISNPQVNDLEFQVNNRACELVLQVTQMCNLCCSYCAFADNEHSVYQRKHSNKTMQWEIAKKSIDKFLENSFENTDVHFGFYGGEPFAAFSTVKRCVEYIEENFVGKRIHMAATTNGTLLNDEIIRFIVEHNIHIMFSIDGPKSIHDINRTRTDGSGSFESAFSNLKKVVEAFGDRHSDYVSINMVINPNNDIDEVAEIFYDDFIKKSNLNIRVTVASDEKRNQPFEKRNDFEKKIRYKSFLAFMNYFRLVDGLDLDPIEESFIGARLKNEYMFTKKKEALSEKSVPAGPCIPGQRKIFVDVDGNYFPCERVNELLENVKIGSVNGGIDLDKCKNLLNFAQKTGDICRNCFAFRYCGVCAAYIKKDDDFSYDCKKASCEEARKSFKSTLRFIALKKEYANEYWKEINS